ncbi:hypothetical protein B0T11DRAFT_226592 [Plectosphaerella cucumerina]|uniref:Uncharacterized protein n=1 Tax=Plectosphaerella cucumerina TaxID=40658 RepID=A0A8K0TFH4_9PEZI|nr:hypothetical protein B0T11DRAFT_226592 [Plectosphaerella cucumerina]
MTSRLPARTASPDASIWTDLPEVDFRRNILALERLTNAVPLESQVFSPHEWTHASSDFRSGRLSLIDEQRLADDTAYIAAVGEGAQSVAAATVQESRDPSSAKASLAITIASMDAVDASSQDFLRSIFSSLSSVTSEIRESTVTRLAESIIHHHRFRLLNRLRSTRWVKPAYLARTHKKPLHADLPALVSRVDLIFGRRERTQRRDVEAHLATLSAVLTAFEEPPASEADEDARRLALVRACYDFCTSPVVAEYYRRLRDLTPTSQVQACLKTLHQTEKIAAYYRIPLSLVDMALARPGLFANTELCFLLPYEPTPLETAYQPWASAAHVHAEVSLAVHHDTAPAERTQLWQRPRCVGASKYLCYLCYLFVRHHGAYFPSATHGACYDQWTVPDLADFPEALRHRYAQVLRAMTSDIRAACIDAKRRPEPMTSRENLLDMLREGTLDKNDTETNGTSGQAEP